MKRSWFSVLIAFALALIISTGVPAESYFQVTYFSVGQGDSALVECDGERMLIDGGPSSASSKLYSYMKKHKIKYLDYVMATHADADHVGGLPGALKYAKAGTAFCSVTSGDTKTFKNFLKALNKRKIPLTVPYAGEKFSLGSAQVYILNPIPAKSISNDNSIVMRIIYGDTSFLFTGDIDAEQDQMLVSRYGAFLRSDVLKVAHHGSDTASTDVFLKTVKPKYAVVSAGKKNQFGHPTPAVLLRLNDVDAIVYRTDKHGDIVCSSDGENLTFTTKKKVDPAYPVHESTDPAEQHEYVLNKNTKVFHRPTCSSVKQMAAKNRWDYKGTRAAVINLGYRACKNCKP